MARTIPEDGRRSTSAPGGSRDPPGAGGLLTCSAGPGPRGPSPIRRRRCAFGPGSFSSSSPSSRPSRALPTAPGADERLKALEAKLESLEFELDQVRKSNDDVLFWLRLSDVAEVDKVSIAGPPNPRGKERYGIANERHPMRFAQYVFAPKKREAGRKYPVVVLPHGGVHGDFGTYHVHIVKEMLEKGWVVLAPEYRGSTGYGKGFHDAIDYGGLEVDDVVAGLDWAVAELPYVDGSRAAIAGWSHGGLIALLAVMHHPEKFRAAYAGVPVTDLVTRLGYHEQSYEDLFAAKNHVGKKVVEDVDEYRRRSPVFWASKLKTPLLSTPRRTTAT